MTSEEHIQLESDSVLVSSDARHVQTAVEPPPPNSEPTELPSQTHEPDMSAASTTVLDRTLVEEDDPNASIKKHAKVPSAGSTSKGHVSKKSGDSHSTRQDRSVEGGSPWHPLHNMELTSKGSETQGYDHSMVLVEDDITDSKRKLSSNRTSHFHLNLKPSSPQPWDHIDPPSDNNHKSIEGGYYSPSTQQKFHTMQKARRVFPFGIRRRSVFLTDFISEARPLIPKSSYYFGPPPPDSAYGTAPTGHIGIHHPREILRVERDYTGGELIQFAPIYPLELEGRVRLPCLNL